MIAAISLTLVLVLALTSSASAECAWVLWGAQRVQEGLRDARSW